MLKLHVKYWQPRAENGQQVAQAFLTGPGFDYLAISSVEQRLQPITDYRPEEWAYVVRPKSNWHLHTGTGIEVIIPDDQLNLDISMASHGNQADKELDGDHRKSRQDGAGDEAGDSES